MQAQIKRERTERVTKEIHIEYFEDVSNSLAVEIANEVFKTDVTQRLQDMEKAENAVKLSRTRHFFGIWRKYYQNMVKLKRAVTEFPATGSLKGLKVQNERLTGHKDNKIIDNQFLVGKAQLTILSPLEILKRREDREYKCAVLDLKRTMQSVLTWQPEDVSQLVHKTLQKKIPNREKGKKKNSIFFFIPPQTKCFRGYTEISLSVCLSVSICVQNTNFCQSNGGGIKSHLLTALVFSSPVYNMVLGSPGVRHHSCIDNNFFKYLLVPSRWANLDQTWQECSLGGPL